MLSREELVEQAYLFRCLVERARDSIPLQDLLVQLREEVLAVTKLPLALDFLAAELRHAGVMGAGMQRLAHYFTPFQAYLVREAEDERGRFELRTAFEILRAEAAYRAEGAPAAGVFLFQFETLCRNRLKYDKGLDAIAADPLYDEAWREWIREVRRQAGLLDLADLIYVRSRWYAEEQKRRRAAPPPADKPPLFGEKEGRIALANRRKDPLYLFSALQRQLGYPAVPRPLRVDETPQLLPQMLRRLERIEARLKLVEEENRGGIDITKFYGHLPAVKPPDDVG